MSQIDDELVRLLHGERLASAEKARQVRGLPPERVYRSRPGAGVRGWLSRHSRRPPSQPWEAL